MGAIKQTVHGSLPDRLIWTNSQIALQIESTLGCGRPSLIKIWISDQQWGQNNAWATTLVTTSSWVARQMFRLCPAWVSELYFSSWRGRNVLLWYGCRVGKCVPALRQAYIQGLMTARNVNQRFNKQNRKHTWCTHMCMKWLRYPLGPFIFWRRMRAGIGKWMELEEDTAWPAITNTSRAWLGFSTFSLFLCILESCPSSSSHERSQRSIFWTGLLLNYDCVCLCCGGRRENGFSFQINSPAGST